MQENQQLLDVLTRAGVLITVSVRFWRATKKLNAEDLGLDPDQVTDRLISLGHKKLLPKEALEPFALIEGRAHRVVESSSFPFLGGLGHFVPNAKLPTVVGQLESLNREFGTAKTTFLARYTQCREQGMAEWRTAAQKLAKDPEHLVAAIEASFPPAGKIEGYFRFNTQLFQIRTPEAMALDLVTCAEQEAVQRSREDAARNAAAQIRQGVDQFVRDCVASLRQQTAELCTHMLETIQSGKSGVHQKTLNRLTKFIDEFKQLNFVGDRQMEEQLDRVRRELLNRSAEEYRDSETARNRLKEGLQALGNAAHQLATQDTRALVERFGQMGSRQFHLVAER